MEAAKLKAQFRRYIGGECIVVEKGRLVIVGCGSMLSVVDEWMERGGGGGGGPPGGGGGSNEGGGGRITDRH